MRVSYTHFVFSPVAVFALFITFSTAHAQTWTQTGGPEGGAVPTVCIDSFSRIFIGTEAGGVFETTDRGSSWIARNAGLSTFHVRELEANAKGYIFAVTYDAGVFRWFSDDNPHWTLLDSSLTFGVVTALACAPNSHIFIGSSALGIVRSTDEGHTWATKSEGIDSNDARINILTASASSVLALTSTRTNAYHIYSSTDDGEHWSILAQAPSGGTPSALLSLPDGTLLYGDQLGNLYRMRDGKTWERIYHDAGGFGINNVVRNPHDAALFLRTNYGDLYRSSDTGTSWSMVSADSVGGNIYATGIDTTGTIYVGTDFEGVLRSDDNGKTFTLVNQNLISTLVYGVACDRRGNVFAVTEDFIWRSTDRGATWERLSLEIGEVLNEPAFAIDSIGTLYLGNLNGIWVSQDSGRNWTNPIRPTKANASYNCFALEVSASGVVYGATQYGLLRSVDHGVTWDTIKSDLPPGAMKGVVVADNGDIYADDGNSNIYRSIDTGQSWTNIPYSTGIVIAKSRSLLFSTSKPDLFRSTDSGATWDQMVLDPINHRTVFNLLLDRHGYLLAPTDSGVYLSKDNGNSWASISDGLKDASAPRLSAVTRLCEDGTSGIYYAASRGQGIFRSVLFSGVSDRDRSSYSSISIASYPNPFRGTTQIRFDLPKATECKLEVRDVLGTVVWSREFSHLEAGEHTIACDLKDAANGNYFCLVKTADGTSATMIALER